MSGGAVPYRIAKPRIQSPAEAQAIAERLWIDDQPGNLNRGLLRAMVDGQPPWDRDEMARNGQLQRCNVNWLTGRAALMDSRALYVDMVNSVPTMITGSFLENEVDPTQGAEWGRIIDEEFTRTLRNWGQFQFQLDRLIDEFVGYGVCFAGHQSIRDWRWHSLGLGDVLFPRSTRCDEEHVEIILMRRAYFPFELLDAIRDDEAENRGWNIKQVMRSIANDAQGNDPRLGNDFETLEKEMFEATFYYSYASKTDMIWTDHLFTRENDGTYTHQIVLTEKGGEFLFEKESQFECADDFFTLFPNGGGNGDIHGQRGLLFDIFPQTQAINQIQCGFVDNVRMASGLMLQVDSEEGLEDLGMIDLGPCKIFPPKVKVMPTTISAPSADAVNTVKFLMEQQSSNTGQYNSIGSTNAIQDANTAQQGRMVSANDNILSQSQANTFYNKWTRLLARVKKRLCLNDWAASEPGGKEALEFQKRCYARGIPTPTEDLDVLNSYQDIQAVRAIGYGSPANRMSVQAQLVTFAASMSPQSQNELMRMIVTSLTDTRTANILFPMETLPSQAQDQHIADLENALMRMGQAVPVAGNNLVHATSHSAAIVQMSQEALQGKVQPSAIVSFLQPAIQHTQQHVELLAKDHINQAKAQQFTPILAQANALMQKAMSIQQKNQALAQQMGQEQQAANAQEAPDAPPPVDPLKAADVQSKIQERSANTQIKAALAQSTIQSKVQAGAHKDAALASKIQFDSQKQNLHNRAA